MRQLIPVFSNNPIALCAAFCPKQVLVLKKGKVTKANPDACIKCGQCEQRCPDYAIYLEKVEEGAN